MANTPPAASGDQLLASARLASEIKRLRSEAGLSQPQLARQIGYSRQYVSLAERDGQNLPSEDLVRSLDKALKASGALLALREKAKSEQLATRAHANGDVREGAAAAVTPQISSDVGLVYPRSIRATVEAIAVLGRSDMERRKFLAGALFSVAASIAPSRDWLVATLDEATEAHGRVNAAQVDAIRRTFAIFQELDVMRGGGHARTQLAAYLEQVVVPLLRDNDPDTTGGRELFGAASEQLYLLGWMAFDNSEHTLAQRYLIQSLRLAEAAKNIELGAHVLAGLSDQATLTGNPDQGVQLARTGIAGLQRGNSAACLADLRALQARALAVMGDKEKTTRCVAQSEDAFSAVVHEAEPEWARFIDAAYLNGEYAHAFRDLGFNKRAIFHAQSSADESARQRRARRGSLAHAAMARAALADRDLETATSAGMRAVELAVTVKSSRSNEAVRDVCVRLQKHSSAPGVKEFFEKSNALMPVLA